MPEYEMARKIFNQCALNHMRDVFFEEIETEDTDEFVRQFCTGTPQKLEKDVSANGTIVYDIETDGLVQQISFTTL